MADLDHNTTSHAVIDTAVDVTGAPIVTVSGELDMSNAASLDAAVTAVTADGPERLIFDLSAVRFMDSAGIAVLVRAAAKVKVVVLREPSPVVSRVVELTGLSSVLVIEP